MPRQPRLNASEAEQRLQRAGFKFLRSKGSHRICGKGPVRIVVPFHAGQTLYPKTVKEVLEAIEQAENWSSSHKRARQSVSGYLDTGLGLRGWNLVPGVGLEPTRELPPKGF